MPTIPLHSVVLHFNQISSIVSIQHCGVSFHSSVKTQSMCQNTAQLIWSKFSCIKLHALKVHRYQTQGAIAAIGGKQELFFFSMVERKCNTSVFAYSLPVVELNRLSMLAAWLTV